MERKKYVLICLLAMFLPIFIKASVEEPEKNHFMEKTKKVYKQVVKCKKAAVNFVKNHPFITAAIFVTIVSKKAQQSLQSLPNIIWNETKNHPLVMAILGGFSLSYIVV